MCLFYHQRQGILLNFEPGSIFYFEGKGGRQAGGGVTRGGWLVDTCAHGALSKARVQTKPYAIGIDALPGCVQSPFACANNEVFTLGGVHAEKS